MKNKRKSLKSSNTCPYNGLKKTKPGCELSDFRESMNASGRKFKQLLLSGFRTPCNFPHVTLCPLAVFFF